MKLIAKKKYQFSGNDGAIYGLTGGAEVHNLFSCGSDKLIRQWNLMEGNAMDFALRFPFSLYSVFYKNDKNQLICGTSEGTIVLLNLQDKSIVKEFKQFNAAIFDIKFSAKNSLICVASGEGSLTFIDSEKLEIIATHKLCVEKIRDIAFNSEETEIAVACGDGTIRIFDMVQKNEIQKIVAHGFSANSVLFHPNGKHLISGGKDAYLKVWEKDASSNYALKIEIPAHNYAIYSIAFHPNKKYFATASRDKMIKLWDADDFSFLLRISKENQEGHINSVNKLHWSSYSNYLISAGDDRSIIVWDIVDG